MGTLTRHRHPDIVPYSDLVIGHHITRGGQRSSNQSALTPSNRDRIIRTEGDNCVNTKQTSCSEHNVQNYHSAISDLAFDAVGAFSASQEFTGRAAGSYMHPGLLREPTWLPRGEDRHAAGENQAASRTI